MKAYTRKILALILAMVLIMGVSVVPAFATDFSITIDNAIAGETYNAYKVFDVTYSSENSATSAAVSAEPNPDIRHMYDAYTYTIVEGSEWWSIVTSGGAVDPTTGAITANSLVFYPSTQTVGGHVVYNVINEGDAFDAAKAADLAKLLNDNKAGKTIAGTVTAAGTLGDKVSATINLGADVGGYYFLDTSLGSLCSLDTTEPQATIREKNIITTQDKTVKEDSTNGYGDKNDADFGQTVEYKTTVTIAKYQKNVVYHDVMQLDKLALNWDSVTVSGAGVAGHYTVYVPTDKVTTGTTAFTTTGGIYAGDTFAVAFDTAWTESLTSDTAIEIEYTAVLTTAAAVGPQSGLAMDAGNDNKSSVTYGDAQRTAWDWTRTYTWPLNIYKYTGESVTSGEALADAQFNVKKAGTALVFVETSAGDATNAATYRLAVAGDTTTTSAVVSPESGKIVINGLDADDYSIEEIKAPDGYNLLKEEVAVTLDSDTDTAQGTDGATQAGTLTVAGTETIDSVQYTAIQNQSGLELPATGGIGTTIFYIIGAILVLGAGVLLVTRRKMNK